VLLQALERDGSVTRPAVAPSGRVLPTSLTPEGRRRLAAATVAVRGVEQRMLAELDAHDEAEARRVLRSIVHALASEG
jgi:DNA-binding MarR family transcriptional regulator